MSTLFTLVISEELVGNIYKFTLNVTQHIIPLFAIALRTLCPNNAIVGPHILLNTSLLTLIDDTSPLSRCVLLI